jgi:hypothetical protein
MCFSLVAGSFVNQWGRKIRMLPILPHAWLLGDCFDNSFILIVLGYSVATIAEFWFLIWDHSQMAGTNSG